MKTTLLKPLGFAFILGITLLNFSNCNKLLDAFELNSSFSDEFTIDIGPDDDLVYMDQLDVDLTTNQDFVDNGNQVRVGEDAKLNEYIAKKGLTWKYLEKISKGNKASVHL